MSSLELDPKVIRELAAGYRDLAQQVSGIGKNLSERALADGPGLDREALWGAANVIRTARRNSGILPQSAPAVFLDQRGVPFLVPDREVDFMILTDCADAEAQSRLALFESSLREFGPVIKRDTVQAFDKAGLGFILASVVGQLAENARDPRLGDAKNTPLVIIGNSAPREDQHPDAKGCQFVLAAIQYAKEPDRFCFYVGTFGEELSYVKQQGLIRDQQVHVIALSERNNQFRSRFEPWEVRDWLRGEPSSVLSSVPLSAVPEVSSSAKVGWVDCFGNIKLNFGVADELGQKLLTLKPHQEISVRIGEGGDIRRVKAARSIADGKQGEILIYPGSSFHNPFGAPNHLFELAMIKGSAAEAFANSKSKCSADAPLQSGSSVSLNL